MKTHVEHKPRSAAHREDGFAWRYAAICGETFIGGGPEHRIAEPGKAPTCPDCDAKRAGGEE